MLLPKQYLLAGILLLTVGGIECQEFQVSVIGSVQVQLGKISITGSQLNVSNSSAHYAVFRFTKLPYAEPPTGDLRFAPPVPLSLENSTHVDATQPTPSCPLIGFQTPPVSEDCLYLSVRTPNLTASRPVLVFLSYPAINSTDGDVFVATQDVVLVSIGSRQGVLGYLAIGNTVNNLGLQDQRMALRLIRDAVGNFGGDPSRVTLGGHGAGAAAVGLHAVTVGSRDLFQRVVMLGGSIASPLDWSASLVVSKQLSRSYIENVCGRNIEDPLSCLRNASLDDLIRVESELKIIFVPVGEGEFFNNSMDSPDTLWRKGAFEGPLLVGATADSGRTYADGALGNLEWDKVTNSVFNQIVDQEFRYYPRYAKESSDTGRCFLRTLFSDWPDQKFGLAVRPLLTEAIGDFRYICPVWEAASDLVRAGKGPAFVFLHDTADPDDLRGTGGHMADARYFLGQPLIEAGYKESHRSTSRTMMRHLATFLTDNVTLISDWSPLSLHASEFMHYKASGDKSVAENSLGGFGLSSRRCPLWKHLFPFLNRLSDSVTIDPLELKQRQSGQAAIRSVMLTDRGSAKADTIRANYTIGVIGFGQITGQTITTDTDVTMTQFLGLPYAKPPLGNLRFAKPERPTTTSDTVHLALKLPPLCLQNQIIGQEMSEDCLYLNLWTPMHADQSVLDLPVIIFLHGGFFQSGSVSDDRWRGSRMLNHAQNDVIVVTVSYRLGVFGFLSLDNSVKGNFGLWDQSLAIDWVNQYIDSFGGSDRKVTLMGVESGAVSIGYHLAHTKLHFQRAIMLTGSPYMLYPVSNDTVRVRFLNHIFAESVLGCSLNKLDCLRALNASFINDMQQDFQQLYSGIEFPPVIDGDFIPSDPVTRNASSLARIPILIGGVDSPGNLLAERLGLSSGDPHYVFLKILEDTLSFFPRFPIPTSPEVIKTSLLYYTAYNDEDNTRDILNLASAIGNRHFTCPNNRFLDEVAEDRPVYSFRFNVSTSLNASLWGSYLFNDAYYAFGNPATRAEPHGPERAQLSKTLIRTLVRFADSGSPQGAGLNWPEFRRDNRTTLLMQVNKTTLISDVFMGQECALWDQLLPGVHNRDCTLPKTTATSETTTTSTATASTKTAPPTDITQTAPPTDTTQTAPPTDITQTAPPTDITQTAPPTDTTQTAPPTGITQTAPPTDTTQTAPPTDITQTAPPTDTTQTAPTTGITQTTALTGTTSLTGTGSSVATTQPPIGPNIGVIVGIVIGSVVGATLLAVAIYFLVKYVSMRNAVAPV